MIEIKSTVLPFQLIYCSNIYCSNIYCSNIFALLTFVFNVLSFYTLVRCFFKFMIVTVHGSGVLFVRSIMQGLTTIFYCLLWEYCLAA